MTLYKKGSLMAEILKGKPVADRLNEETSKIIEGLDHKPTLSVIRVGENEDDISYEKAIIKRCEKNNISCKCTLLANDISKDDYLIFFEIRLIKHFSFANSCNHYITI